MKVSDKYLKDLLREVVSIRANGKCEFPGCINHQCDPHHAYSQKNNAIKYDYDSCINLCVLHHTAQANSAHKSPYFFKKIIIENLVRSEEWFDAVLVKAQAVVKDDRYFREMWKEKLLAELKRLGARGGRP
jgi:hypothetical protein